MSAKLTIKRTKLHHLKKILGEHALKPLANAEILIKYAL